IVRAEPRRRASHSAAEVEHLLPPDSDPPAWGAAMSTRVATAVEPQERRGSDEPPDPAEAGRSGTKSRYSKHTRRDGRNDGWTTSPYEAGLRRAVRAPDVTPRESLLTSSKRSASSGSRD